VICKNTLIVGLIIIMNKNTAHDSNLDQFPVHKFHLIKRLFEQGLYMQQVQEVRDEPN